jgi:hypothetical protein
MIAKLEAAVAGHRLRAERRTHDAELALEQARQQVREQAVRK